MNELAAGAVEQLGRVDLGDKRRRRRAVEIAQATRAAHPARAGDAGQGWGEWANRADSTALDYRAQRA